MTPFCFFGNLFHFSILNANILENYINLLIYNKLISNFQVNHKCSDVGRAYAADSRSLT